MFTKRSYLNVRAWGREREKREQVKEGGEEGVERGGGREGERKGRSDELGRV